MPRALRLAWVVLICVSVWAQTPTPQAVRVIGEVVAVDADARLMSVKTDSGEVFTLFFQDDTKYLRVPPGEKTLDKAVPTTLAEIGRGDRVYARGVPLPDGKSVPATQLVVMSKAAIDTKQQAERDEWRRRGILGIVKEVRPAKKEIVLQARTPMGQQDTVIQAGDDVKFRRYAPDSVRFSDAKPSSLAELKPGDQLRALGQRNTDGTFKAEQVVSGSFQTLAGTVTAVNADGSQLTLKPLTGSKPMTVVFTSDSVLRRFPKEFAAMMAQRMGGEGGPGAFGARGGAGGPGGPGGFQRGPAQAAPGATGASPAGPAGERRPGTPGTGGAGPAAAGGPGGVPVGPGGPGMRRGMGSADDLLERLPPLTLAELKPGETVMLVSTTGKDPSKATAIAFVAGVEAFLATSSRPSRGAEGPMGGQSLGMPSGLEMGIGLP